MKVIEGTTEQCLAHLAKAIAGRDFYKKRTQVAVFAGVSAHTAYRWFNGAGNPIGGPLIRLRYYLEFLGYNVTELENLQQQMRDAGRMYAFGVVDLNDLMKEAGIPDNESGRTQMFNVLRGVHKFSDERIKKVAAFIEKFQDLLVEKQQATPNVLSAQLGDGSPVFSITSRHGAPKTRPPLQGVEEDQTVVIQSFAGLITAMLPLAEYVLSDSFTADQRSRVRELAGGGKDVSRLSNLFTQLSAETVRTVLTKQQ